VPVDRLGTQDGDQGPATQEPWWTGEQQQQQQQVQAAGTSSKYKQHMSACRTVNRHLAGHTAEEVAGADGMEAMLQMQKKVSDAGPGAVLLDLDACQVSFHDLRQSLRSILAALAPQQHISKRCD